MPDSASVRLRRLIIVHALAGLTSRCVLLNAGAEFRAPMQMGGYGFVCHQRRVFSAPVQQPEPFGVFVFVVPFGFGCTGVDTKAPQARIDAQMWARVAAASADPTTRDVVEAARAAQHAAWHVARIAADIDADGVSAFRQSLQESCR